MPGLVAAGGSVKVIDARLPPAAIMAMIVEVGGMPALAREERIRTWITVAKKC